MRLGNRSAEKDKAYYWRSHRSLRTCGCDVSEHRLPVNVKASYKWQRRLTEDGDKAAKTCQPSMNLNTGSQDTVLQAIGGKSNPRLQYTKHSFGVNITTGKEVVS